MRILAVLALATGATMALIGCGDNNNNDRRVSPNIQAAGNPYQLVNPANQQIVANQQLANQQLIRNNNAVVNQTLQRRSYTSGNFQVYSWGWTWPRSNCTSSCTRHNHINDDQYSYRRSGDAVTSGSSSRTYRSSTRSSSTRVYTRSSGTSSSGSSGSNTRRVGPPGKSHVRVTSNGSQSRSTGDAKNIDVCTRQEYTDYDVDLLGRGEEGYYRLAKDDGNRSADPSVRDVPSYGTFREIYGLDQGVDSPDNHRDLYEALGKFAVSGCSYRDGLARRFTEALGKNREEKASGNENYLFALKLVRDLDPGTDGLKVDHIHGKEACGRQTIKQYVDDIVYAVDANGKALSNGGGMPYSDLGGLKLHFLPEHGRDASCLNQPIEVKYLSKKAYRRAVMIKDQIELAGQDWDSAYLHYLTRVEATWQRLMKQRWMLNLLLLPPSDPDQKQFVHQVITSNARFAMMTRPEYDDLELRLNEAVRNYKQAGLDDGSYQTLKDQVEGFLKVAKVQMVAGNLYNAIDQYRMNHEVHSVSNVRIERKFTEKGSKQDYRHPILGDKLEQDRFFLIDLFAKDFSEYLYKDVFKMRHNLDFFLPKLSYGTVDEVIESMLQSGSRVHEMKYWTYSHLWSIPARDKGAAPQLTNGFFNYLLSDDGESLERAICTDLFGKESCETYRKSEPAEPVDAQTAAILQNSDLNTGLTSAVEVYKMERPERFE